MALKEGQVHRVRIERCSGSGDGVARIDGMAVFVRGALRGETAEIVIEHAGRSAAWAAARRILVPSPARRDPDCPYYGECGGCRFRHMSYEEELAVKRERVEDALRRIGGADLPVAVIRGAARTGRYRNKVQFPVAPGPKIGFFRERSHRVVDVEDCLLQPESAGRIRAAVLSWMRGFGVPGYDERAHTGLVRHLCVRSNSAGEALVCLVVNAPAGRPLPHEEELIRILRKAGPGIVGAVLSSNTARTNVILGPSYRTLWGRDALEETLCGLRFRLSVPSFFQVNRDQCEILYARALEFAGLTGRETALDLYCGIGTITLCLAKRAKKVIGAEIVPEAIEDARANAARNGIENAEFFCGDARDVARKLARDGVRPDVVVVDPPRKGLAPEVIETVAEMSPTRVVYVSCDPATLARDVKLFIQHGYAPARAEAVDMFPGTEHVETVCLLERITLPERP